MYAVPSSKLIFFVTQGVGRVGLGALLPVDFLCYPGGVGRFGLGPLLPIDFFRYAGGGLGRFGLGPLLSNGFFFVTQWGRPIWTRSPPPNSIFFSLPRGVVRFGLGPLVPKSIGFHLG